MGGSLEMGGPMYEPMADQNTAGMSGEQLADYKQAKGITNSGKVAVTPSLSKDQLLADITRQDFDNYMTNFAPREEALINNAMTDRSLITGARDSTAHQLSIGSASQSRNLSRYGVNLTPAQAMAMKRQQSLGNSATTSNSANNSILEQRDRNLGQLSTALAGGQATKNDALNSLGAAAGMEGQRNAQNAQAKAAKTQQMTSIATAGLMMMM